MRLLRRNAASVYAVYAAAIVSGLVVTPIIIHSVGKAAFGIWTFIGGVTIYLSVLDFGVAPSIIRNAAEARGREAPEDLNAVASTGLAMYAGIGLLTIPLGAALAWLVPIAMGAPHSLYWDARVTTLFVVLSLAVRFPLGLFNNLLLAQQRWDIQNLASFGSTALYAIAVAIVVRHTGSIVLLGVATLAATLFRLLLPLAWLRREIPTLELRRRYVTKQRVRDLASFSFSNFMVHIAQKIVFSTDVIVVGIVLGTNASGVYSVPAKLFALVFGVGTAATSLLFPAFAELEGARAVDAQRRLLLSGLRAGMALMLLLALPLLLIPDLLIHGWIGSGYESGYPVLALLAGVLLVHAPIFVLTQFLIARAQQRPAAVVALATTLANLALSFVLAATVGLWGVALATLLTDVIALAWIVSRYGAPAATSSTATVVGALVRPVLPALLAGAVVLVGVARVWEPRTLLTLAPLGALWVVVAGVLIWRFGLAPADRSSFTRELRGRGSGPVTVEV
jgi:O-antigen/teichoic acid export membrane protein